MPQLLNIFDSLLEGIQIIDFNWRYVYVNSAFASQVKTTKEKLFGYTMMEKYPGIEQTAFFKALQKCMKDRKPQRLESEFIYAGQSSRWFDFSIEAAEEGIYIMSLDITEHKEDEKRISKAIKYLHEQNEEKGNRAAELIIANKELDFQNKEKENRAAELVIANKELAFQNEEKGDRAAELIIANKELLFQNEEKEKRAQELIIANKELDFQNKEKEKRAAELIIANKELLFQNKEKEKRAQELIIANKELDFQNQEKEKRADELVISNEELVKINSELDRFVYSVSHDLRSPVTSMLGLISFIEEESHEADTLEHAKMIHNSINSLDGFIKNILSYSKNNRIDLEVKKIQIQKTIDKIVGSLHKTKEAEGIHFEVNIEEKKTFYSDQQRFITIMENLISNSIKHHKKDESGRYIKITGTSDNGELNLCIIDNGIGIASEYHTKIFDMFFRLSGKVAGSGIGLYIVKETVDKLQGSIQVHSEEGTGAIFDIKLKNLKP